MAVDGNALDAGEVAAILQVSRNTVYNLAKSGQLASYSIGRKMRFTMSDVDAYIALAHRGTAMPGSGNQALLPSVPNADSGPSGSRDPSSFTIAGNDVAGDIVASYLGQAGAALQRRYLGSYQTLCALYSQDAHAAVVHLFDGATGRYNIPFARRIVPGTPLVMFHLARRKQGLLVTRGNPKQLREWADVLGDDVRLASRSKGTGERILLDEQLVKLEAGPSRPQGYEREFSSPLAAAAFVTSGGADVAIGSERLFHQVDGLDFLPPQEESLDFAVVKTPQTERVIPFLRTMLASRAFREELSHTIGYDTTRTGSILFEC